MITACTFVIVVIIIRLQAVYNMNMHADKNEECFYKT